MENNFIRKIRFDKNFRCFKKGDVFEFRPGINMMVGDQGCGKSSLFYSIINYDESGIAADYNPESSYKFFDTERMNPHISEAFEAHRKFEGVDKWEQERYEYKRDNLIYGIHQKSHGEVLLPIILSKKEKGLTYFVDEPESGLSIRSQYEVLRHYQEVAKDNQLIIATHSLVLIESVDEVLSLEHKRWMPSKEFIESQKTPAKKL